MLMLSVTVSLWFGCKMKMEEQGQGGRGGRETGKIEGGMGSGGGRGMGGRWEF